MNIEDVLALVKAGFTREEISQMLQSAAQADPNPAEPVAEPEPAPEPAPAEPAQPAQEQTPAWAQALSVSLAALNKAVQTINAMLEEQPAAPALRALDAVLMKQLH